MGVAAALRARLPTSKTLGDLYELTTKASIEKRFANLGLQNLRQVGGSGDRGIDLIGQWNSIELLVQCKATRKRIPGNLWRDLRGLHSLKVSETNRATLIALASPVAMTPPAYLEFSSSRVPFMHCIIAQSKEGDAVNIESLVTNAAAQNLLKEKNMSIN